MLGEAANDLTSAETTMLIIKYHHLSATESNATKLKKLIKDTLEEYRALVDLDVDFQGQERLI